MLWIFLVDLSEKNMLWHYARICSWLPLINSCSGLLKMYAVYTNVNFVSHELIRPTSEIVQRFTVCSPQSFLTVIRVELVI
jgi:hypothetical protein